MDTDSFPQPAAQPEHPSYAGPGRRASRWRAAAAGAVAGALLASGAGAVVVLTTGSATTTAAASAPAATRTPSTTQELLPALPDRGTYGGGYPQDQQSNPGSTSAATGTTATDAQSQGLVLIDTTLTDGEAAGTGMILDADGTVLTNYHVVEGSTSITVTDAVTGTTYDAEVVGHDATADVALLQLDGATDLTPVTLDDDGDPAVSDTVTAVGNAEGQGFLSASSGTVEALAQSITTSASAGADGESLTDLIETDAYVVGGYSGGALLDAEGEVVGITTAASSGTQVAESYAVPIEDALAVVGQIEAGTESAEVVIGASPYLGVQVGSDPARRRGRGRHGRRRRGHRGRRHPHLAGRHVGRHPRRPRRRPGRPRAGRPGRGDLDRRLGRDPAGHGHPGFLAGRLSRTARAIRRLLGTANAENPRNPRPTGFRSPDPRSVSRQVRRADALSSASRASGLSWKRR